MGFEPTTSGTDLLVLYRLSYEASTGAGRGNVGSEFAVSINLNSISIYTLSDLGVLSNLIGSLSLANEHYSPPTE